MGKETTFGLLKAIELFVHQDYDAVLRTYDERAKVISDAISRFGVTAQPRQFDPQALGNVTPYYSWKLDSSRLAITRDEVMQQLADTRPVGIGSMGAVASGLRGRNPNQPISDVRETKPVQRNRQAGEDAQLFGFAVWQLKTGEDRVIADRLVEIFSKAPKA